MEMRHRGSTTSTETRPAAAAVSPSKPDSHGVLQLRLRSVSQESDELLMYTPTALQCSSQMPEIARESSPIKEAKAEVPSLTSKVKDLHDDLENWGYNNYPVITDHFNFLVYGIDLAVRSVKWFQFGFAACWLGFRLCVYAIMLLPAFVRIMLTYYHDARIHRRIRFGPAEREYLDIYVPKEAQQAGAKVPVVVAIMGGAFIIGHRGYNAQLGLRLMDFGIITVGIDYRNFPRGTIPDMVEDVSRGLRWVFQNIERYGGDTSQMLLMGQSAGAHLASMLLLEHALLEAKHLTKGSKEEADNWSVKDLKGFLGISGPYHLQKLGPHLASRGLYPGIMTHMTGGDLLGCSPEALLQQDDWKAFGARAADLLPPIHLFHGDRAAGLKHHFVLSNLDCVQAAASKALWFSVRLVASIKDKAVPVWSSVHFAGALKDAGAKQAVLDVRKGMTHTYPVVEGPMKRHDPQVEIILPMLFGPGAEKRLETTPTLPPMANPRIIDAAGVVSPF